MDSGRIRNESVGALLAAPVVDIMHTLKYKCIMEKFGINFLFSAEKNQLLIKERGISFEEIISAIHESEQLLEIIEHANQAKYPNQKMYVVEVNGYIYLVPFVEKENTIFLKTIFPSRKAKKKYFGGNKP